MEGAWRGVSLVVASLVAAVVAGCGGSAGGTVTTDTPAQAFAPVVHLHPAERFMPMDDRWFLSRSALWFAEDMGCEDRKIAVGKRLKAQQNEVVDWLFETGIGWGRAYWRQAYVDGRCDDYREAYRYYANQLTRPHHDSPDRAPGLRLEEGYYLDLMDWGRSGAPADEDGGQAVVGDAAAWYESRRVDLEGEPGLRLTYWMLFGMNAPAGGDGRPVAELTHEGDWERVQIDLREGDDDGEWGPVAVRLADPDGGWRSVPWDDLRRAPAGSRTHPVLYAARGSHTLYARPRRHARDFDLGDGRAARAVDVAVAACARCPRWQTWQDLSSVRKRDWYGFGGAWGEPGLTDPTTGPLGPHGDWAKGDPADDLARSERRP